MAEVPGGQYHLLGEDVVATLFVDDGTWHPVRIAVSNGLARKVQFRLALASGQNLTQVVQAGLNQSFAIPGAIRNRLTFDQTQAGEDFPPVNPEWSFEIRAGR